MMKSECYTEDPDNQSKANQLAFGTVPLNPISMAMKLPSD